MHLGVANFVVDVDPVSDSSPDLNLDLVWDLVWDLDLHLNLDLIPRLVLKLHSLAGLHSGVGSVCLAQFQCRKKPWGWHPCNALIVCLAVCLTSPCGMFLSCLVVGLDFDFGPWYVLYMDLHRDLETDPDMDMAETINPPTKEFSTCCRHAFC